MSTTVVVLPGDGIGPEIWAASRPVLDAASKKVGADPLTFVEFPAGQVGIDLHETPLPRQTLDAIEEHKIAFKGPLTTPVGGGFRSVNVALRLHFDLYANIRPIRCLPGVPTPVHKPENVDIVLFRENTEDVYAGFELEPGSVEALELGQFVGEKFGWKVPADAGLGLKPISESASKRLVRASLRYAREHKRDSVTLVHKGNIQKFTEGRFCSWGYEVARDEFGDCTSVEGTQPRQSIVIRDLLADAFLQEILIRPERFSIVSTTNLNGDYAADALAAQVGGVGVVPGANINTELGRAVFEQTHGTAPSIAGRNIANPIAMVLSGAMLFDFLEIYEAASAIRSAVESTVGGGFGTQDLELKTVLGTDAFGAALVDAIERG